MSMQLRLACTFNEIRRQAEQTMLAGSATTAVQDICPLCTMTERTAQRYRLALLSRQVA